MRVTTNLTALIPIFVVAFLEECLEEFLESLCECFTILLRLGPVVKSVKSRLSSHGRGAAGQVMSEKVPALQFLITVNFKTMGSLFFPPALACLQ